MSFTERKGDIEITGDFSQLEKLVEELGKSHYVDVGILGENNQSEGGGITTAGIGAVHEFGTDRAGRGNSTVIPERSFIRMPLETGQGEIEKQVETRYQRNLETGNIKGIFTDIGIAAEARIQDAFDTSGFGKWDPNAESTAMQKGSSKPLIDDGTLRKSISSKVGQ